MAIFEVIFCAGLTDVMSKVEKVKDDKDNKAYLHRREKQLTVIVCFILLCRSVDNHVHTVEH